MNQESKWERRKEKVIVTFIIWVICARNIGVSREKNDQNLLWTISIKQSLRHSCQLNSNDDACKLVVEVVEQSTKKDFDELAYVPLRL